MPGPQPHAAAGRMLCGPCQAMGCTVGSLLDFSAIDFTAVDQIRGTCSNNHNLYNKDIVPLLFLLLVDFFSCNLSKFVNLQKLFFKC